MWPNFLVIGAAKAGTTALFEYLRQHPQVHMAPLKETNFFASGERPLDYRGPGDAEANRHSITTWEAYCEQFRGVTTEAAVGEASPLYLYGPTVPGRVARQLPGVRLLAILRHPAERAYSAFSHMVRDRREPLSDFAAALEAEPERIAAGWEHIWHYAAMGHYGAQLARYYALFDADRIRVLLYEDLSADPLAVLADCFRFLGVDDAFVPDVRERFNESAGPDGCRPAFPPEVRARLVASYADDVACLERLVGRDLSAWRA